MIAVDRGICRLSGYKYPPPPPPPSAHSIAQVEVFKIRNDLNRSDSFDHPMSCEAPVRCEAGVRCGAPLGCEFSVRYKASIRCGAPGVLLCLQLSVVTSLVSPVSSSHCLDLGHADNCASPHIKTNIC